MENVTAESQTPVLGVIPVVHIPPRQPALHFELLPVDAPNGDLSSCIYADELDTLTFGEMLRRMVARVAPAESDAPTGLGLVASFRVYASEEGKAAFMRMAEAEVSSSE
jgi:hypothetical protein